MKLLLIQPPIQDFYDTEVRLQPIGLAYLKAAVKKFLPEVEVKIVDFHRGWGRRTIPVPRSLQYLKPYYPYPDKSPFCTFHSYYHFGASFDDLARVVSEERPDWVGISSLFSPYYREVLAAARAIKKIYPVPILVGGSHVSAEPLSILENPEVDYIVRAEGERPLVEFLRRALRNGGRLSCEDLTEIPNLGFKVGGRSILNDLEENYPLEELPPPDLEDFSLDDYRYEGRPLAFLVSSRSCPHRCSFCSVHATFGTQYRRNSIDRVLEEIKLRYDQGYRVLDFEDDNLTFYRDEMKEICLRLVEAFPQKDLQLLAMNGISYLSLDGELLSLMKDAGFTHLNLALVTSDTTVRESTKRPHTVEKFLEVVTEATRLGLKVVSYQILGLPQESLASMVQTLCFAARLPVLLGASPFYLTPNSPIARAMGHRAGPEDCFKARLSAMAIESENFSRDQLYTLFVTTRILNFLKSWPILSGEEDNFEQLLSQDDPSEVPARTRIGLLLLKDLFREGVLRAWTPDGKKVLEHFDFNLFQSIWSQLQWIATQGGGRILIDAARNHAEDPNFSTCRLRAVGNAQPTY